MHGIGIALTPAHRATSNLPLPQGADTSAYFGYRSCIATNCCLVCNAGIHRSEGIMMKSRLTAVAGLLSGAVLMLITAPALARADISVDIWGPGVYVEPAPVYVSPPPVYVQPRPMYQQPQPYYAQPQPYYREQQYRQDWRQRRWNGDHRRRDRDRDGVPNRYDRDRDGDGVPNRFDRRPNNPYRD